VPPLPEQERIAAGLTASLVAVDGARRAAADRLAAAEALPAAYLRDVFEGPDAVEWSECELRDLLRWPIRTGLSKPGRPDSDKRCLTLTAVRGRTLDLSANKPAEVNDREAEGNWVRPGCFYVVRGNGNKELVGRGAFAPDPLPQPVLFPDLLFQLDLSESVDPGFFWCLWSCRPVRDEIEERARTAAGIYKINTANLNSLPVRLPPLAEQRRIAAELSAKLAAAEALIGRCREEVAAVDALPAALLRAAFGG
jgi:type I restriction enzyme, S subunit